MLSDQAAQLPAGVAAGAEYTYRNFMHEECITLHSGRVNDPVAFASRRRATRAKLRRG